ncbi:hydantoinase/oxoprolinase N-terminal domain-containing protein [Neobacillus sp. NPDC097160]|uniref:hydantoinase/oxoprolinase N-terminal domain-containing protein n=1 Tax=Neobacillus sp. NPDC097160 TaxID=3364298 RepID=UPI0037F9DE47
MKIGIDIGGTTTHAVLVTSDGRILQASQHITTPDLLTGVKGSVQALFERTSICPAEVKGIFIGTTELINAIFEGRVMSRTALIRIGTQPTKIEPAITFPETLRSSLKKVWFVKSSNHYNHATLEPNIHGELFSIFQQIEAHAIEAVSIVGTYSPMYEEEELWVKKAIKKRFPNIAITVSHRLGSIGYIERENAAILNALFSKLIRSLLAELSSCFSGLAFTCPFWLTKSDGSLMTVQEAMDFPVLTIFSGVANSLKGAAILTSYKDLLAVDIGGSKIYAGRVRNEQLREVNSSTNLAGIDTSLAMPEFISLPFGGGSIPNIEDGQVRFLPHHSNDIAIEGLSWGGSSWTVSDCFLKLFPEAFYDEKIDTARLADLSNNDCELVVSHVMGQLKLALDQLQESEEELPIVLVGGGSPLFGQELFGQYNQVMNPAGYPISSAIGACFAQVSEVVDKVYWLHNRSKEEILDEAVAACKKAVLKKGASPESIHISYVEEYPFAYLRGEILRVRTRAMGALIL